MPTIKTKIWLALRARVESLVLSPVHPIAWPNENFTPTTAGGVLAPYLEVMHLPNTTDRLFINRGDANRFAGILQVSAMYRLGLPHGETIAGEIAGLVAAHFPADLYLPYSDIRLRVTKEPDVAQGFRDDDTTRWKTPVSIRYEILNI